MDPSVACVALDGGLGILWQGVASLSPDSSRSLGIQAGWEAEWFRFRAELFLILFENEGSGLGGGQSEADLWEGKGAVLYCNRCQ